MKKNKLNQPKSSSEVSKHLINGVTAIMITMETPTNFLNFLSEGIMWIDSYRRVAKRYEKNEDSYLLVVIIQEVVIPWFAGGNDCSTIMAKGLKTVYDYFGVSDYSEGMAITLEAYSGYISGELFAGDYINRSSLGFHSLSKIYYALEAFDQEKRATEKEKEAL